MKQTKNLVKITNAININGPISAVNIQYLLPDINKSVIYRTIKRLLKNEKIIGVDLSRGEIGYEIAKARHHHLICEMCSSSTCLDLPNYLENSISKFEKSISSSQQISHKLDFVFICDNCN